MVIAVQICGVRGVEGDGWPDGVLEVAGADDLLLLVGQGTAGTIVVVATG